MRVEERLQRDALIKLRHAVLFDPRDDLIGDGDRQFVTGIDVAAVVDAGSEVIAAADRRSQANWWRTVSLQVAAIGVGTRISMATLREGSGR